MAKALGIKPKVNIELSFCPDEETGGRLGMGYLAKKGILSPDYVIDEGPGRLVASHGNKGMLSYEIEVLGKSSHAAYSFKGINAFEYAVELAAELKKLKKKVERRRTKHDMENPKERRPSFVMGGKLSGGIKYNTVPGKVVFSIDRRVIPDEDFDKAQEEIQSVIRKFQAKNKDIKIKTRQITADKPVLLKTDSVLCSTMSRCIKEVYGKPARFRILSGGTDMRYLVKSGASGLGYGPIGGNFHADDEWVDVESMVKTCAVYASLISRLS